MKIVVNDASILIDLLKIDMSDDFFRLPFEMHTTDLVSVEITDESAEKFGRYVEKIMIKIQSFSSGEWEEVNEIKANNPPLSLADCSCLCLCNHLSATLLTSDGRLRKSAIDKSITVHGILWVFEQLVHKEEITAGEAASKLKELMEIYPRLPREEYHKRLKNWKT
jgi:predicted nucleic acid-binding protein